MLDRFVTYRIGGSPRPERRLLIVPEDGMWPPAEVSLSTPLGITLLGLSVGDRMCMIGADERQSACVEILAVGPSAASGIARQPAFSRGSKLLPVVG
ncbi:hypothetical protein SAZ10_15015 [Mesorhizobium sp. BAC0120]|uniref:hypothetical protein n=1 Tax=Mesorhizobium sp. BAC0120 TaxID=3090670 RepID=UPI00298CC326|nr:hypothetical protein [Mesorhizobium sp. BAC0120]MDW6023070.1 hypothetical protein [Mesorhizobium sp. BAC0120]